MLTCYTPLIYTVSFTAGGAVISFHPPSLVRGQKHVNAEALQQPHLPLDIELLNARGNQVRVYL